MAHSNKCAKYLLFVFNFLFFLTGFVLIGIGLWLNIEQDEFEGISDFNYISVGNVGIAAGAIIVIVAFFGCCGAITESRYMLLGFFLLLLLIFILEISAGIAAYVMRGEIKDELRKQLEERIPDLYYTETGIWNAMNAIQKEFACCGVNGITDWGKDGAAKKEIHETCCKLSVTGCQTRAYTTEADILRSYNTQGCFGAIENFLEDNLLYVGITGVIFSIFQLIGMVLTMTLYTGIQSESNIS